MKLKLGFISDTHTYHDQIEIPECDILICTGDITHRGRQQEVESFGKWFRELPIRHKVLIPGNHDITAETQPENFLDWLGFEKQFTKNFGTCYYIQQRLVEIEGLKIWGEGSTPRFGHGWGLNVDRGPDLKAIWDLVESCDVLASHGPPYGILDWAYGGDDAVGCRELLNRIRQLEPTISCFGHVHEDYGIKEVSDLKTLFINASTCSLAYRPDNPPIVVEVYNDGNGWEYIYPTFDEAFADNMDT